MRRIASFLLLACACSAAPPAAPEPDAGYGKKPIDAGAPVAEAGVDCTEGSTPSATYPAAHPPLPQLGTTGGPVLAHPRFVPIVFAGDDRTSDLGAFFAAVGTSSYWSVAGEYGIGPATATAPVGVDETPPSAIDDATIQAWLAAKLDGTHDDFGAADASAIYVVYYPTTTTITAVAGDSCIGFGGYHSETKVGATKVVYAVIARCPGEATTSITSHELFEAATDPYYYTAPAYRGLVGDTSFGAISAEIGDLCEDRPDVTPVDVGFPVARVWSNAASAAAHEPCVPNEGGPYFRTVADSSSVVLAPGGTTTIELRAFSDQPTGPWTISLVQQMTNWQDALDLSLCRTSAQNGESIPLTITRPTTSTETNRITVRSTLGGVSTIATLDVGD